MDDTMQPATTTAHCPTVDAHPDQVLELGPDTGGVWLVRSRKNTTHVWDLDAMTYRRQPGPGSSPMLYDNTDQPITNVGRWPAVDHSSLVFFDDPQDPTTEHWRICSRIRSITRIAPTAPPGENGRTQRAAPVGRHPRPAH
ncbi:hypothetical protein GCM10009867_17190 [Pedococcus aerophilus]|uniref:Uncharacterized protein n=1 Tax=Pedococcus aerophilus TaxID=436356 RepID=A0ABN3UMH7_9MICO